jgi:hypothetical protein
MPQPAYPSDMVGSDLWVGEGRSATLYLLSALSTEFRRPPPSWEPLSAAGALAEPADFGEVLV